MFTQCSFKIIETEHSSILEIWPFGLIDFQSLLKTFPSNRSFMAVKNPGWQDGFHPPDKKMVKGTEIQNGFIVSLDFSQLKDALANRALQAVPDLKCFFPEKNIRYADFRSLEDFFSRGNESSALKKWSGWWIHVHDNCKAYIITPKRSGNLFKIFSAILTSNEFQNDGRKVRELFKKINLLPNSQCFILSWFGYTVRCRIENVEVHDYEQIDKLISKVDEKTG